MVLPVQEKTEMNHTVWSSMVQACTGTPFFLAVAGLFLACMIGGFTPVWSALETYKKGLLDYGLHYTVFDTAMRSEAVCLVLPICCTFPFAASFLEEFTCGFIKSYLARAGRRSYVVGKILATGASGGSTAVLSMVLYYQGLRLLLLPMEKAAGEMGQTYGKDVGKACVLFFCAGALFALVGMLCSIVTSSRYMAYAFPFVLEYVLIMLHERYLKQLFILDPKAWLHPVKEQWGFGEFGAVIFMILLVCMVAMLLTMVMLRRLETI